MRVEFVLPITLGGVPATMTWFEEDLEEIRENDVYKHHDSLYQVTKLTVIEPLNIQAECINIGKAEDYGKIEEDDTRECPKC